MQSIPTCGNGSGIVILDVHETQRPKRLSYLCLNSGIVDHFYRVLRCECRCSFPAPVRAEGKPCSSVVHSHPRLSIVERIGESP